MTWARLDDAILDNPKILRAGPIGFALHVAAITWCARNLTDGFIPKQKVKHLLEHSWSECLEGASKQTGKQSSSSCLDGGSPRIVWELHSRSGSESRDAAQTIDAVVDVLVEVGLWDPDEDDRGNVGYRLHDYCVYNPTREKVLRERVVKGEAGRAGGRRSASKRKASAEATAQAAAKRLLEHHPEANGQAKLNPVPVPVPYPPPTSSEEDDDEDEGIPPDEPEARPPAEDSTQTRDGESGQRQAGGETLVPCPRTLSLTPGQVSIAEQQGISPDAVRSITARFVGSYLPKQNARRTLEHWLSGLNTAVHRDGRTETLKLKREAEQTARTEREPGDINLDGVEIQL